MYTSAVCLPRGRFLLIYFCPQNAQPGMQDDDTHPACIMRLLWGGGVDRRRDRKWFESVRNLCCLESCAYGGCREDSGAMGSECHDLGDLKGHLES